MTYNPKKHNRRSIRLPVYDYSQAGAYFLTIITHGRVSRVGKVIVGEMHLNEIGEMTVRKWLELEKRFPFLELDEYVVMPNHPHGILVITGTGAAGLSKDTGIEVKQLRPHDNQNPHIIANSLAVIIRS